jgi:hypothetical protein
MPYMHRLICVFLLCIITTGQIAGQGGQPVHQGSIEANQASGNLTVSLTKDQTVSYAIELSSDYAYGASVLVEGFNFENASLFRAAAFTGGQGKTVTVTLPAGSGHLVPYRGTAHRVGRPSYLVVTSLNNQVNYSVFESKTDREDYNEGGVARAQAKEIAVFETVKGNVHWIEGNAVTPGDGTEPGGQWFKVTLEPRQTIRPYGTALGPATGAAFQVRLYDESGSYLTTLLSIPAYGSTTFPSTQAPGAYLYQNTAALSKTVYLQVFAGPGIVHDFEFSLVEIMMEFKITSQHIDRQNNYSEDTTIEIQAVRADTRAPLTDVHGFVSISEINGDTYTQNGGSLPSSVQIPAGAGGKAQFVAKSLVGPRAGVRGERKPLPAEIRCSNFRQLLVGATADDSPLQVEQWFDTEDNTGGPRVDPLSVGEVPDWLRARVQDIFAHPLLSDADKAARDAVESYSVEDLGTDKDGQVTIGLHPKLPVTLNPYNNAAMRLNSLHTAGTCGPMVPMRYLTAILLHEARHCYQFSQASDHGKNADRDALISTSYQHEPTSAAVDSTSPRIVCDDENNMIVLDFVYQGDATFDQLDSPDYARWGLEFDAYHFTSLPRPY